MQAQELIELYVALKSLDRLAGLQGPRALAVPGFCRDFGEFHRAWRRLLVERNWLDVMPRDKDDRLHGGDFVEVYFDAGSSASVDNGSITELTVPTEALVQLQGETVVFRRNAAGALEPVPVRIGEAIGDRTMVREGVKAGDVVVASGAFTLKSQMLKSQLGEE